MLENDSVVQKIINNYTIYSHKKNLNVYFVYLKTFSILS